MGFMHACRDAVTPLERFLFSGNLGADRFSCFLRVLECVRVLGEREGGVWDRLGIEDFVCDFLFLLGFGSSS
jgi:hypothetical protein